jgi:protein SCO1
MSQNKPKNYSYIWISFIVLVFGIYVVPKVIARFSKESVVQKDRLYSKTDQRELKEIAKAPQFSFVNENGEVMTNEAYKGKVYVVEFFFTACPTICPVMNENMRILDDEFYTNDSFAVASFSIDGSTDTSEVLKAHAKELGVKSPNWHFFTATQEDMFAFAKNYNMYAAANPDVPGGFEHSGMFALVDKNGKIRSRLNEFEYPIVFYDGLEDEGLQMLKEDIKQLLAE